MKNMIKDKIAFGIDLGTTTSTIFLLKNNKPNGVKFEDENGDLTADFIHSIVGIDSKSNDLCIVDLSEAINAPELCVEQVKRKMGTRQNVSIGAEVYSPQEISAKILKFLKSEAEKHFGVKNVEDVVITVPAMWKANKRAATKKAGELAGFKNINLINEPAAAALAYTLDKADSEKFTKLLIYDLGGGTFDITVGEFYKGTLEEKAHEGDENLGGKDFDAALRQYVIDEFKKENGIDLSKDKGLFLRLLFDCERIKKKLSFKDSVKLSIPRVANDKDGNPLNISMDITREKFEDLISNFLEITANKIKKAIKAAKRNGIDKIDKVLLVGGSTRIPYVREIIEREMEFAPESDIDPDLAVGMGASIYAASLKGTTDAVVLQKGSNALGTKVLIDLGGTYADNMWSEIMPKNGDLGVDHRGEYCQVSKDQKEIKVEIVQVDLEPTPENSSPPLIAANHEDGFEVVGNLMIPNVPSNKDDNGNWVPEKYEVIYNLDHNALLKVKVKEESTGREIDGTFQLLIDYDEPTAKNKNKKKDIDWMSSKIADDYKPNIVLAEKKLENTENKQLLKLCNDLKKAVAENNEKKSSEIDDKLTDLLFDLS